MTRKKFLGEWLIRLKNAIRVRMQRLQERRWIPAAQHRLLEIIDSHPEAKYVLVFPPGLGWQTHLFQRPQQLARALARQGVLVFYMQPELSEGTSGYDEIEENLVLCRVPTRTFEALERPLTYVLTWNRKTLNTLDRPRVLYDFVDDLSAFDGNPARLASDHAWLVQSAELVMATSESLLEQVRPARPDALFCPNGVDYDHFALARRRPAQAPPELAPLLAGGAPVIGYHGALARWFDYDLLRQVADRRPSYTFLLIGPDFDQSLAESSILQQANIHWIGLIPYERLPAYLAWFDTSIIPFHVGDLAHATSPLKLFEYMASGLPVVIPPLRESMRYPGALVAHGPDEFATTLDRALELHHDPNYLARLDQTARENTWEARARTLLEALGSPPIGV